MAQNECNESDLTGRFGLVPNFSKQFHLIKSIFGCFYPFYGGQRSVPPSPEKLDLPRTEQGEPMARDLLKLKQWRTIIAALCQTEVIEAHSLIAQK